MIIMKAGDWDLMEKKFSGTVPALAAAW